MAVGPRLRRVRLQRGMTQQEVAAPKYTHAYISSIESGRRRPSPAALTHFAQKLGVDVGELATGRPSDQLVQLEARLQEARRDISAGEVEAARSGLDHVTRAAKRLTLPQLHARAETGRALVAERLGRFEDAISHCEVAQEILRDESLIGRVQSIAIQARCLHMLGDTRHAAYVLESALDEIESSELRDPSALIRLHASLVAVYFELGLVKKASDSASIALALAPRTEDPETLATMHLNVARVHLANGKVEEAQRSLQRAADLFELLDFRTEMGRAHFARAYVLSRQEGSREQALVEFDEALRIFQETGSGLDEARALQELAHLKRISGNREGAIVLLGRSIPLLEQTANSDALAWSFRELAACHLGDDLEIAEKDLRKAIDLFDRADEIIELSITYRMLGDVLTEQKRPVDAVEAYRTGLMGLEDRFL